MIIRTHSSIIQIYLNPEWWTGCSIMKMIMSHSPNFTENNLKHFTHHCVCTFYTLGRTLFFFHYGPSAFSWSRICLIALPVCTVNGSLCPYLACAWVCLFTTPGRNQEEGLKIERLIHQDLHIHSFSLFHSIDPISWQSDFHLMHQKLCPFVDVLLWVPVFT